MSLAPNFDVVGVASTIRALSKMEPELAKAARAQLKAAAAPLVQNARSNVPTKAPLSGFTRGRLRWSPRTRNRITAKVSTGRVGKGKRRRIDLIKVVQPDAAGVVFDMAGKRPAKTAAGAAMVRNLNARYGQPSRSMWRNVDRIEAIVTKNLREAVEDLSKTINRAIGKV